MAAVVSTNVSAHNPTSVLTTNFAALVSLLVRGLANLDKRGKCSVRCGSGTEVTSIGIVEPRRLRSGYRRSLQRSRPATPPKPFRASNIVCLMYTANDGEIQETRRLR